MKRAILRALICLSISSSSALAVDWSLNTSLFQTIELNNNLYLNPKPIGGTLGSYSSVFATAAARAPTWKFAFDGDINYRKYWGPGTSANPQTESTAAGVAAHYETFGKDNADRQYINGSWRTDSSQFAILSDLGFAPPTSGRINVATLRGGIERNLSATDFVSLSARSALTYYDPRGGGTEFLDTAANLNWKHRLNGIASFSINSEAEWLRYDNAQNSNTIILRNTAAFDVALSPLIDVHAAAGAAYVQVNQQGSLTTPVAVFPASTGTPISELGSAVGFIGDLSIIYRMLKSTTLSLTARRNVTPSVIGTLVGSHAIGANLDYLINQKSSLTLSGNFDRQTSGGTTDFISASIGYNRELARQWNANLSYRYLHRSATSGANVAFDPFTGFPILSSNAPASSNAIILTIWHSVTVLPFGR